MDLKPTQKSLDMVAQIATVLPTFHHHYHILYDIAETFGDKKINYVEVGAYAGGSSCLMLQRPNTTIASIDLGEPISKGEVLENVIIMEQEWLKTVPAYEYVLEIPFRQFWTDPITTVNQIKTFAGVDREIDVEMMTIYQTAAAQFVTDYLS
jgi:hypothetical protein